MASRCRRMKDLRNCVPSALRDRLAAHAAVRLGRLNRFVVVRRLRDLALRVLARGGDRVKARILDGFDLFLPAHDRNLMEAVLRGVLFETAVAHALRELLRQGDVFVDGGAHVGLYTLLAAKRVGPAGRVIAFEPHPLNAQLLRLNVARSEFRSRVVVEEAALTAHTGTALFHWSPSLTTHGRFLSSPAPDSRISSVRTLDLDCYVSREVGQVDLIKLDLEGGEVQALQGMRSSLVRARCAIIEVNEPRMREQGLEPSSVVTTA